MSQTCPNCQTHNPVNAQFCHNCGTRLAGSASHATPVPVPPQPPQVSLAGVGALPVNQGPYIGQPQAVANVVPAAAPSVTSKMAIASLVLAILSMFCFGFLTGIPAAILGWMELSAIKQGRSDRSNAWMAHVGIWGGIIMSILSAGGLILMILLSAASAGMNDSFSSPYGGYYY